MTTETSNAREWVSLLERAVPFLHDEAAKYDDDGSNEPLELAREIETLLASLPSEESALSSASLAFDGGREATPCPHTRDTNCDCVAPPPAAARGDVRGLVALAEQMERDAAGCRRDGYTDAAVVKEDCAQRIRQTLGISAIAEATAAEGVQAGEVEQRARELLAAAYDRCGLRGSYYIANPDAPKPDVTDEPEYMVVEAACSAIASALSQQPEARGVLSEPDRIGLYQGPDDCPQLMVNGRAVAIFPAGSWAKVCDAMDSITGSEPKPEARGVVDDSALEALIGDAEGARWSDDEFRIDGRGLMKLLRDAAALTGERND